ncbi:MAG: FHA domain-containing protein [Candidatus Thermoplasmatota archaeon]|nr:FHA domain-containing protein [Candidatus Thermoplasmatota archaeon]MCL5794637.1 FHA domain-containing protein [Candidatus Thermoplasmatota archaeon]
MVKSGMKWIKKEKDRETEELVKICPMCNARYDLESSYCTHDGHRLILEEEKLLQTEHENYKCMACGYVNTPPLHGFCVLCGEPFGNDSRREKTFLFVEGIYPIYIDSFPLDLDRNRLARLEGSEYVNSPHVRFMKEGSEFYVKDMNSLNGTSLNGRVIGGRGRKKPEKERIFSGDTIELCLDDKDRGVIRIQFKVFPALT